MYSKGRGSEREGKIETTSMHWFNGCNTKGLPGLKPGSKNSVWVSPSSGKDPNVWAITCCLPRLVSRESWLSGGAGTQTAASG